MRRGHAALLQRKIALAAPLLHVSSSRFWEHERLTELFPKFLLAIHGSVSATVPLMTAAIARLRSRAADDPLGAGLIEYLDQHRAEEADHEEWLLRDLEAISIPRQTVLAHVGFPAIAALVGAQYYWIHCKHPIALLGLFAVLEGHPPSIAHLDEVQRRTGIRSEALRMLRRHAELDARHGDEVFELIDRLPLETSHVELLGISALHTMSALGDLFQSLIGSDGAARAASAERGWGRP